MAETASDAPQSTVEKIDSATGTLPAEADSNESSKRGREEEAGGDVEIKAGEISKKAKVDDQPKEAASAVVEMKEKEEEEKKAGVKLGPKEFDTGETMFNYFFKFLHSWPSDVDVNKYEHMVLLELLKKGHVEPDKKIGLGIQAFQVRIHPLWKSRCFFLVRIDGSSDDFSFRKCVDHILPLPQHMKLNSSNGNKKSGGHQKGGGGGGRGRHGKKKGRGGI